MQVDNEIQESWDYKFLNLLSGNPERYLGRLLCTKNGNPDWDSEHSYSSLPAICAARCRGATVSRPCLLCYQLVSQWSVAADKILFPSIRLPDVICVELVYQHHNLQRIQLHRLTELPSAPRLYCECRSSGSIQLNAQVYI